MILTLPVFPSIMEDEPILITNMQRYLAIATILVLAIPGCLEDLKDEIVSCENLTGACRYEILQSDKYSRLHIEIDYVTEHAPDSDAVDLLKQRIKETTSKTSISVSQNSFGSTDRSYSMEEILDIEKAQREIEETMSKAGEQAVIDAGVRS